jgi:hypothetical protein
MQENEITRRFQSLDEDKRNSFDEYNYEHFKTKVLIEDGQRTVEARGIKPGETAPGFELPEVGGGTLRLSDLRGKPTILHFGSYS